MRWWQNPAWTTRIDDGRLVLSGGADALFLVDEVDAAGAARLHRMWHEGTLEALDEEPALRAVLDAFAQAGAIARARPAVHGVLRVGVAFAGDRDEAVAGLLAERGAAHGLALVDGEAAEIVLVWRTNGDLLGAAKAAPARKPHLLVDVAYHHTLSLGPLVWPGETACIGCLAGRIAGAWGDPSPPSAPAAGAARELVAALALDRLRQFANAGTIPSLVERAVSLDLETLASRSDRVHRLPWCPSCFPERTPWGTGAFALPWSR